MSYITINKLNCLVAELEGRPLPAVRFASHNRDRAHTLQGKHVKDHQRQAGEDGVQLTSVRSFLLFEPVGVSTGEGFYQFGLPVIDVSCGSKNNLFQ